MALRIFLAEASALFTDHRPIGDGLIAAGFVRELAARGHELHVAVDRADLRERLPANVHVHSLEAARGRSMPVARLTFMSRMRRLYAQLSRGAPFDVVHQLNPVDVGLSLALAGRRVPLVLGPYWPDWPTSGPGVDVNARASPAALGVKRLLRAAEQRRSSMVVLSTPAAAAKLEASWPVRLTVREISPGIDPARWTPGDDAGNSQDVLFLSNLEVRKGVFVLLDAFERLADLPGARLIVAGAGAEEDELRRRVAASPAGRIELLGGLGREHVLAAMRSCGVYCLPSYAEPFGMAALEAMACARPLVATRSGGLQHVVDDEGGRRVPVGDPAALAAALREVLGDPSLRRAMGQHNRRRIERRYAWTRVVDRLEDAYADAISGQR
jgi:glycosyltransferase involved in cell wall biosynthesis